MLAAAGAVVEEIRAGMVKKIFFAIPIKTGQMEWVCVSSLLQAQMVCDGAGWGTRHEVILYESLLANARNVLVAKFMASDCTDLFWVDDDVGWTRDGFMKLMTCPLDFVCIPYRHKLERGTFSVRPNGQAANRYGMLPVDYCGLGITKMNRGVFERMIDAFPACYYPDELPELKCHALFEVKFENGAFDSEDVTFCKRWRSLGGDIWIDPGQHTEHVGKKSYAGAYGRDA